MGTPARRGARESYRKLPAARSSLNSTLDVLHRRPRGAPAAHPEVPGQGGPATPRGVGGEDLPRLDLSAVRGAWLSWPPVSAPVRRTGRGLLLGRRPLPGGGQGRLRRASRA